jgi:hypothetical protein
MRGPGRLAHLRDLGRREVVERPLAELRDQVSVHRRKQAPGRPVVAEIGAPRREGSCDGFGGRHPMGTRRAELRFPHLERVDPLGRNCRPAVPLPPATGERDDREGAARHPLATAVDP